MSNLDQALQIMSDYWDAAYCEGSTGINQSANANDCLHRMRQLLQAHDGEVVAWLHTVRDAKAREGDTDLALSFDDHSFPLDSIGWVSIKAQPLYTAPPRVVVDRAIREMERYLPVLERLESRPLAWIDLTDGLGIATLNGYKAALKAALEAK